jgi:uncharacterized cofD-like protein
MYKTEKLERTPYLSYIFPKMPTELRVAALGGGTGLPVILRSLKGILFPPSSEYFSEYDSDKLTAIVTVTDDGGSSGRLRKDFNILPPGDIRNCLSALSDSNTLSSDLFQYRFEKGDGLVGHSLGNLFLTALADIKGNFIKAIQCCSQIIGVKGQVLPFTSRNVTLVARFTDGWVIRGESAIARHKGSIRQVFLNPSFPDPLPSAIDAIEKADVIIIGPGSLYTSIIPNLLVKGIARVIKKSKAKKIYICNLMTEPGETDGYTATDHIRAIFDHTEYGLFQYVILNKMKVSSNLLKTYIDQGSYPVSYAIEEIRDHGVTSIVVDVMSEKGNEIRHDEDKLGRLLIELI